MGLNNEEKDKQKDELDRRKTHFFKCCDKFRERYCQKDYDLVCDWDSFNSSTKQALQKFKEPPLSALNFLSFSIEQQTEFLFDFFAYCKINLQIKPNNALKNVIDLKYRPEEFREYFRHPALLPDNTECSDSEKELAGILEFCRFYRLICCSSCLDLDYSPDDSYFVLFPKSEFDLAMSTGLKPDQIDDGMVSGYDANARRYLIDHYTKDIFRKIAGIEFGTKENHQSLLQALDNDLKQWIPDLSKLSPEQEIRLCYSCLEEFLDRIVEVKMLPLHRDKFLQDMAPQVAAAFGTTAEMSPMKMRDFWGEYLMLKSRLSAEKDVYESIKQFSQQLSETALLDLYTHRQTEQEAYYAACPTGNDTDMDRCQRLFRTLSEYGIVQPSSRFSPAKWKILSFFLSGNAPNLKMPRNVCRNNVHLVGKRSGNKQEGTPRKRGDFQSYKANNIAKELIFAYEADSEHFDITYDLVLLNIAMNAYAVAIPLSAEDQSMLFQTYFHLMDKYCKLYLETSQASFLFKLTCLNHVVDMYFPNSL